MSNLYNASYYSHQKDGSFLSAKTVVPLVLEYLSPASVIDVGCGVGTWLAAFKEKGIAEIQGLDGEYVDKAQLKIPQESFKAIDLSQPIPVSKQYDLAVSLEVAEHLPDTSAAGFVSALTSLAPVVLFSAAVPFQGGTGHINEQWPDYWMALFKEKGYVPIDPLRRRIWNNSDVEWWYAQNIMFYVKEEKLGSYPKLAEAATTTFSNQLSLAHPRSLNVYTLWHAGPTLIKRAIVSRLNRYMGKQGR